MQWTRTTHESKHPNTISGYRIFTIVLSIMLAQPLTSSAQTRVVVSAVPTLRIIPDARGGAMGDAGIARPPDAAATFWNPASLPFIPHDAGFQISAIPWLPTLVKDIWIYYLSGYYQLPNQQAIGGSIRYFDLGSLQCTDINGEPIGESNPHEYAIDVAYGRMFTDRLALGIALRFIYSNLTTGACRAALSSSVELKPAGTSLAGDIALYYRAPLNVNGNDGHWALGVNISNLGAKIAYTTSATRDFLPMNLGIGGALYLPFNPENKLTFTLDINKLLVPTPDSLGQYREKSVPEAIFTSFADAPNGAKEELQEVNFGIGAEYTYGRNNDFTLRAGYFFEHPEKGNRQFLTIGIGLQFKVLGLDISYLIPTTRQPSPLEHTFRFTFRVNLDRQQQSTPRQ